MPKIFLVLHSNNKEKKIEIPDKPKKVGHIPVLVTQHFNFTSTNCRYKIIFNDQIKELKDDEEDLTKYYTQSDTIEIHILTGAKEEEVPDWMKISVTPMLASQTKKSSAGIEGGLMFSNFGAINVISDLDEDKNEIEKYYEQKIIGYEKENFEQSEEIEKLKLDNEVTKSKLFNNLNNATALELEIAHKATLEGEVEILNEKAIKLELYNNSIVREKEE